MTPTSSYILGISAEVFKYAAQEISPVAVDKIRALFSNRVLVVGNKSSGKTSFINYLRTGILVDQSLPRRRSLEFIQRSPSLNIEMGDNKQFRVILRTCMEIPGQVWPEHQAMETITINPDGLIIVVDVSESIDNNKDWLDLYCEKLEDECRRNSSYGLLNYNIKSIILMLNKFDKVSYTMPLGQQEILDNIVRNKLVYARGNLNKEDIIVLPCCSVENAYGSRYINNVIYSMIMDLQRY